MRTIKRFGGFPCCHRQWKDEGHCSFLHGYDRWVQVEWEGERDHRGWVVDFAALKKVRAALEHQYDHTTLISPDDPALATFERLHDDGVIDLRITDPTMEGMALWVKEMVTELTKEINPTAVVIRVECWENEKNAAVWTR